MRPIEDRLQYILDTIQRIEQYSKRGRTLFEGDELVRVWIVYHCMLLREACAGIPSEFRSKHPEVPWREVIGMRDKLIHQYFGINGEVLWETVEPDLPV